MAVTSTPGQYFLADADKMSGTQLVEAHIRHPNSPDVFDRSTLVIGDRGAGKTFLLRHRKLTSHPGAIYISLLKELQSISRDAGLGGRTLTYPETLAARIRGKSGALIAVKALEECCKETDGVDVTLAILDPLVPTVLRSTGPATAESAAALRRKISTHSLDDWLALSDTSQFLDVFSELNAAYDFPLALFLDRAEDVPLPAIHLLLQLLDQTCDVLTILAARPSISELLTSTFNRTLVAGDHYDVLQLGHLPYGKAWTEFSTSAVRNFLELNERPLVDGIEFEWCISLARTGVRDAIALTQIALATPEPEALSDRLDAVAARRQTLIARFGAMLYPDAPNFDAFVRWIREQIRSDLASRRQSSVIVEFEGADGQMSISGPGMSLLGPGDRHREVLMRAIRAEALFLPPDTLWQPHELPERFELAPLAAWDGENSLWIS